MRQNRPEAAINASDDAGPYVDDPTEKLTAARQALANTRKPPPKPIATRGAVA